MSHLDDEALARVVLGEELTADERAHVDACAQCHGRLESLDAVAATLAEGPVELHEPPARVWSAVAAEVGDDAAAGTAAAGGGEVLTMPVRRASGMARGWRVGLIAAASALVGAAATVVIGNASAPADATVVAQATILDLGDEAEAGAARVEVRDNGERYLVLDVDEVSVEDAYLEVWMIDENVEGMVSLGHLTGTHGEFALPEGLDVGAYPIVDVSIEPLDGVPTHSGDSVQRGVLG